MKSVNDLTAEELKDILIIVNMHIAAFKMMGSLEPMLYWESISSKLAKTIVAKEMQEDAHNL